METSGCFLSPDQRTLLIAALRKQKNKKLAYRINCILLLDQGMSHAEVEVVLFISTRSSYRYLEVYQNRGLEALLSLNYRGSQPNLSPTQLEALQIHLTEQTYSTAQAICDYVKESYDVEYTCEGMVPLLHRLGFSYKKMRLVPSKADPELQEEFVAVYEFLRADLEPDEKIYFMDAVHPQHNSKASYGWIAKGEDKQLKSNTGRERININGLYSPMDQEILIREDDTINAQSTISLLRELEDRHPELSLIYIIRDNAKYYSNVLVEEYLKSSKIVFIPLPSYSPNLNLIERLWRFLNKKVIRGKYYEKFNEFREAVLTFLDEGIAHCHEELVRLMTERFQIIRVS